MGNKISFETAQRIAKSNVNNSIFLDQNKYGYKININHPQIRPLYEKYKRKLGAPVLSDSERMRFEAAVLRLIERQKNE